MTALQLTVRYTEIPWSLAASKEYSTSPALSTAKVNFILHSNYPFIVFDIPPLHVDKTK
jgi:hypothetical protein